MVVSAIFFLYNQWCNVLRGEKTSRPFTGGLSGQWL